MLIAVTFLPLSGSANSELALNFEFKSKWEATRGWDKDNIEVVIEERELPTFKATEGTRDSVVEKLTEDEGREELMNLS